MRRGAFAAILTMMCGRYTVTSPDEIAELFQAKLEVSGAAAAEWWKPRYNVAPTQPAPVVATHSRGRTVELMRWGLVPHWAEPGGRNPKKPPLMINARVESLNAKQMFRDALDHKRCLVPTDGFFEWVAAGAAKGKSPPRPFYFHPGSHGLAAFAGLWARSHDARGDELLSFTIITTRAAELVRPIHDRMPIVLGPDAWAAWLDPSTDAAHARKLLDAAELPGWTRDPVSTWVNKADHDDPSCLAPPPPELFS